MSESPDSSQSLLIYHLGLFGGSHWQVHTCWEYFRQLLLILILNDSYLVLIHSITDILYDSRHIGLFTFLSVRLASYYFLIYSTQTIIDTPWIICRTDQTNCGEIWYNIDILNPCDKTRKFSVTTRITSNRYQDMYFNDYVCPNYMRKHCLKHSCQNHQTHVRVCCTHLTSHWHMHICWKYFRQLLLILILNDSYLVGSIAIYFRAIMWYQTCRSRLHRSHD